MNEKTCSFCGTTLAVFKKTGMLGCAQCYETFSKEVAEWVKTVQEGDEHVGKTPTMLPEREYVKRYNELKRLKENAIINGDFSSANEIAGEMTDIMFALEDSGEYL
ncbi:MAG TPA: hypothetical protein DEV87_06065 [Clostridiales bacterium]|nr:hypothetical protein [Clostridiales bacterium]